MSLPDIRLSTDNSVSSANRLSLKERGMDSTEKKHSKISYEQVSIQLDTRLVKKIDARAKKLNLSRSQLLRNLIEIAYEDMVVLDAIGLLTITNIGKKIVNKIKVGLSSGKYIINEHGDLEVRKKD